MISRGWLLCLGVIFVAVVGLALWIRHVQFWSIDHCLDSGGAWDYAAKECRR